MIIEGLDSDDLKLVNMEMHELYIRRQKIKDDLKELDEIIALENNTKVTLNYKNKKIEEYLKKMNQ